MIATGSWLDVASNEIMLRWDRPLIALARLWRNSLVAENERASSNVVTEVFIVVSRTGWCGHQGRQRI